MFIRSLDQQGTGLRVLASFNKGILFLSQLVFIDSISISKILFRHIIQTVKSISSTSEDKSFHISSLGSSESHDSVLGKHIEADRINSLLVNNDESLVGSIT